MRPDRQTVATSQKRHQSTGEGPPESYRAEASAGAAQTTALTAGAAQAEARHSQMPSSRAGRTGLAFQTVKASVILVTTTLAQHNGAQAEAQTFVLEPETDVSTIPTKLQVLQRLTGLWRGTHSGTSSPDRSAYGQYSGRSIGPGVSRRRT